jgi:hypothetical protein
MLDKLQRISPPSSGCVLWQLFKTECWTNCYEFLLRPLAASSGSCSKRNAGQIATNFSSVLWLRPLAASSGKTLGYKGASRGFNPVLGALDFNSARFLITNPDLGALDSPTKTLQRMYQMLCSPFIEPYYNSTKSVIRQNKCCTEWYNCQINHPPNVATTRCYN